MPPNCTAIRTRILEDVQGEHTYRGIVKASLALGRLGCKLSEEGEIVGVMMPNIAPTVAMLLGLGAMRRVPAMLNYTAGPDALRSACIAAGIKTVITSRRFVALARLESAVSRAVHRCASSIVEDLRARFGLLDKLWLMAGRCGGRAPRCAPPIPMRRRWCCSRPAPKRVPRASH